MTLSLKLVSCLALSLLFLPANPALARDPVDVGEQSAACLAAGGSFSVGDKRGEYECDYNDGSYQTCDFTGSEVDCDTDFDGAEIDPINPFELIKHH